MRLVATGCRFAGNPADPGRSAALLLRLIAAAGFQNVSRSPLPVSEKAVRRRAGRGAGEAAGVIEREKRRRDARRFCFSSAASVSLRPAAAGASPGDPSVSPTRTRSLMQTFRGSSNRRHLDRLLLLEGEAALSGFVVLSHHGRSEAQRGAIGAAGQPSQASDETLANRPRRKSRSAGWDASSSAIL